MNGGLKNIHATAIVIGQRGLLFLGPSGAGKSMLALACLAAARRGGAFSALVADDRVMIGSAQSRIMASCPTSIAGLLEIRGSGLVYLTHVASAPMDLAIQVVSLADAERLPPEKEEFSIEPIGRLPLIRLAATTPDPIAAISALVPNWRGEPPFLQL